VESFHACGVGLSRAEWGRLRRKIVPGLVPALQEVASAPALTLCVKVAAMLGAVELTVTLKLALTKRTRDLLGAGGAIGPVGKPAGSERLGG
jgi:hypothetical protein